MSDTQGVLFEEQPRLVPSIRLTSILGPVKPPPMIIYSTRPRIAVAAGVGEFIVKHGREVVYAEAAGSVLAQAVNLPVPTFGVGRDPVTSELLFASQRCRTPDVEYLLRMRRVTNVGIIIDCAVFDLWIANDDRKLGNVVADPTGGANGDTVRLLAIDFEKSELLRGRSYLEINRRPPSAFWPGSGLREHCTNLSDATSMVERIQQLSESRIAQLLERVRSELSMITRAGEVGATAFGLAQRARQLPDFLTRIGA